MYIHLIGRRKWKGKYTNGCTEVLRLPNRKAISRREHVAMAAVVTCLPGGFTSCDRGQEIPEARCLSGVL